MNLKNKSVLWRVSEFVKFSHTIFALPFALSAMLLAANGLPETPIIVWILVAMVGARTAAMAFNRIMDWEVDQRNPRTAHRSQLISKTSAQVLVALSTCVFVMACVKLNWLCVLLSPIAIILIFLYSITKRFTAFSHFFLGLALGVAPVGAWVAVQGNLMSFTPFLLALAVVFWVAGFDLIYALQDMDFDKETGLFSFPAKYGLKATLKLSSFLHLLAVGMMGVLGWIVQLNWMYWLAWVAIVACIAVEQKWARTGRVDLMNRAFFHVNAIVSVLVLAGIGASVWMTSF